MKNKVKHSVFQIWVKIGNVNNIFPHKLLLKNILFLNFSFYHCHFGILVSKSFEKIICWGDFEFAEIDVAKIKV